MLAILSESGGSNHVDKEVAANKDLAPGAPLLRQDTSCGKFAHLTLGMQ